MCLLSKKNNKIKVLNSAEIRDFEYYTKSAHKELFLKFSKWSKKERLEAGALVYNKNFDRFTNLVGITNQVDWGLTEEIRQNEFKDLVNKIGTSVYAPLGWIFRGPRARKKNPTFFLREIEE